MREMVLNHASLLGFTHYQVLRNLKDVAVGMAVLVDSGIALLAFRTTKPVQEIQCAAGRSLFEAFLSLREMGAMEEFRFFMSLTTKTPILAGVGEDIESRFLTCQERVLPPADGVPLLICALTDWIAVGFPRAPWDCDLITVTFDELLPNEETISVCENVDNLTRSDHATLIHARHVARIQTDLNLSTLWERREAAFPRLSFGPDVEAQIADLHPAHGRTIINRLLELHTAAEGWRDTGGAMPAWMCKVTSESASVQGNARLREARRFWSCSGARELFIWHARFGSNGRIHLRFDPDAYSVEIGYIGKHLPL